MPRDDYYQRQEARRERLEARAEKASEKAAAAFKRADLREEVSGIPFGQPILVGHHSEGRHRAAIKRADNAMRRGIEESKKADRAMSQASSVGTAGISSDAPDAIELLREKLAELERSREAMKARNAEWRKAGNKPGRQADGSWIDSPYQLTNIGARIRDTQARLERLEREAGAVSKTVETTIGVTLVENVEANRVQLIFPGKPDEATRKMLKGYGFKWAPSEGAWQRLLNNGARYAGQRVIAELTPKA